MFSAAAIAVDKPAAKAPEPVLIQAMDAELTRAMGALGNGPADAKGGPAPKPYFMSYSVADSESVAISASFGAIVGSNESRRRSADVQIRLGSPAEDNTHGDHRGSALTTVPLPLTDDKEALARSLWFATNRGYGRALDSYLKVKTEQQVRAKEEDSSADFSSEKPTDAFRRRESEVFAVCPVDDGGRQEGLGDADTGALRVVRTVSGCVCELGGA